MAADGEGSRYHLSSESRELLHAGPLTLFLHGPPWEARQPHDPAQPEPSLGHRPCPV